MVYRSKIYLESFLLQPFMMMQGEIRLRSKKAHQLKCCCTQNEQNVLPSDCHQKDYYLHVKAHGRLHLFSPFSKISFNAQNKYKI